MAEDIRTNILLVQAKVNKISGQYILEDNKNAVAEAESDESEEEKHDAIEVLVGTKIEDMMEDEAIKEFIEKGIVQVKLAKEEKEETESEQSSEETESQEESSDEEESHKYYVLRQEDLNKLDLGSILLNDGEYFIVDYTTDKVYFTKGYIDEDGNTKYTVEDKKEVVEEIKSEESSQETEETTEEQTEE